MNDYVVAYDHLQEPLDKIAEQAGEFSLYQISTMNLSFVWSSSIPDEGWQKDHSRR